MAGVGSQLMRKPLGGATTTVTISPPPSVRMVRGARSMLRFAPFTVLLAAIWFFNGPTVATRSSVVRVDWLTFVYAPGALIMGALRGLLDPWAAQDSDYAIAAAMIAVAPWVALMVVAFDDGLRHFAWIHVGLFVAMTALFGRIFAEAWWPQHWKVGSDSQGAV